MGDGLYLRHDMGDNLMFSAKWRNVLPMRPVQTVTYALGRRLPIDAQFLTLTCKGKEAAGAHHIEGASDHSG